jgi:hypothetical protein
LREVLPRDPNARRNRPAKKAGWKTFRIGRGVEKTNTIDAKKTNYATNGIWLFAGEGALQQRKSLPKCGINENIAINREGSTCKAKKKELCDINRMHNSQFIMFPLQGKNVLHISFTTIINGSTSHGATKRLRDNQTKGQFEKKESTCKSGDHEPGANLILHIEKLHL